MTAMFIAMSSGAVIAIVIGASLPILLLVFLTIKKTKEGKNTE